MKTSTQLKALIRNLSKEKDIKPEILLRNFMLERVLERIALSEYKNQFILKGGMLIASIVGIDAQLVFLGEEYGVNGTNNGHNNYQTFMMKILIRKSGCFGRDRL